MTEDELAMTDSQLAKLLEKKERLDAQIKKKKGQLRAAARKADTHAKIVLGGMLLEELNVAWNEVNFEAAAMRMSAAAAALGDVTCEPLDLDEAKKRLRAWEVEKRHWGDYGDDEVEKKAKLDWNADNQIASAPSLDFGDASDDTTPWH